MKGSIAGVSAIAMVLFAGAANASSLEIKYFDISASTSSGDYNICCSSPPATTEGNLVGTSLLGGLPVEGAGGNIVNVSSQKQILWWSNGLGNVQTGTGSVALPFTGNMFAPNNTGSNDTNLYESAELWGTIHGTGADVQVSLSSDDDALVYLDGSYVGGVPGVHSTAGTTIDLGDLTGSYALDIFYADRMHVGANLAVDVTGASVTSAPEVSTWAMMGLGFAGLAFAGYRSRKTVRLAI